MEPAAGARPTSESGRRFSRRTPGVFCRAHGVVVADVPWARPKTGFTHDFEQTAAWLTRHVNKTRVCELLRIPFRTLTAIVERVVGDAAGRVDRLSGLRRIGIDERSFRRGQRYITVVVDHGTGRIVRAREGRDKETVEKFFADLGKDRARNLTAVSSDGASWIIPVVRAHAPRAKHCLDSFHVVEWTTDAVDAVRRRIVNELKAAGRHQEAAALKNTRWALLKNPENQTPQQRTRLALLQKLNGPIYRAYLLKEQLRSVFATGGQKGKRILEAWIA